MGRKYIFASHMGVGNRGCEALTKSIAILLKLSKEDTVIYSKYYEEDQQSDIGDWGRLKKTDCWNPLPLWKKLWIKCKSMLNKDYGRANELKYNLGSIDEDSIVFMTGGDLYCYEGTVKLMKTIHEYADGKNAVSMLIGCSIESKFLSEEIVEDLKRYSLITVRESISLENLKKKGIDKNVYLLPDSAFTLSPQSEGVDFCTDNQFVGINISPYVGEQGEKSALFAKNMDNLISYILNKTEYDIVFIPHVFWEQQDDRKVMMELKQKYTSSRIQVLNSEKMNYCQIRYVISKSKFFFGARTHAVISAYSTFVPTIALGYSVKSLGIAKDLGIDESMVINCNKLYDEFQFKDTFILLEENEKSMRELLEYKIPEYRKQAEKLREIVEMYY